jgi:competence protein ComGC
MSMAKLAIVILIIAALLFVIAPNLSWENCSRASH